MPRQQRRCSRRSSRKSRRLRWSPSSSLLLLRPCREWQLRARLRSRRCRSCRPQRAQQRPQPSVRRAGRRGLRVAKWRHRLKSSRGQTTRCLLSPSQRHRQPPKRRQPQCCRQACPLQAAVSRWWRSRRWLRPRSPLPSTSTSRRHQQLKPLQALLRVAGLRQRRSQQCLQRHRQRPRQPQEQMRRPWQRARARRRMPRPNPPLGRRLQQTACTWWPTAEPTRPGRCLFNVQPTRVQSCRLLSACGAAHLLPLPASQRYPICFAFPVCSCCATFPPPATASAYISCLSARVQSSNNVPAVQQHLAGRGSSALLRRKDRGGPRWGDGRGSEGIGNESSQGSNIQAANRRLTWGAQQVE